MSVPKVTKLPPVDIADRRSNVLELLMASSLSAHGPLILHELIKLGAHRRLQPGQTFQQRDDVVEHITIVVSGKLRLFRLNHAGKVHVLQSIGTGEFLNLLPVLDGGPAIVDVDAVNACELLLIPKMQFVSLMELNADFRNAVHKVIYARNRLAYDQLSGMALMTLRQRCASVLMVLIRFQHAVGDIPISTTLVVSQSELSEILGYSRPKVSSELMALKRDGVIEVSYNRIYVPDTGMLQRASMA